MTPALAQDSTMTIPLWGLVILVGWTMAIVALLIGVRIRHLSTGGSVADFGIPNNESLLWRLFRVQSNLAENLPLYLGVVFLLTIRDASGTAVDALTITYIAARLVHSLIHLAGLNPIFRVTSLAIQFAALIDLMAIAL
jgi:uncharacterized membrane protein YecN with MAPEG domain